MSGKDRRLSRVFAPDGRAVVVPIDHAVTLGPIAGLEQPQATILDVLGGAPDAMLMHRGLVMAGQCPTRMTAGLVVHLSGGTVLCGEGEIKSTVCQVEDAVRLGADAVSVHVSLGTSEDRVAIKDLARVATACVTWEMPLLAMMYVHNATAPAEATVHAARIAAELGADCVKVGDPGDPDAMHRLIESCFVPVLVAGGEVTDSGHETLVMVEEALATGAAGACIGRNVYQHSQPTRFVEALRAIVHEGLTAGAASELAGLSHSAVVSRAG